MTSAKGGRLGGGGASRSASTSVTTALATLLAARDTRRPTTKRCWVGERGCSGGVYSATAGLQRSAVMHGWGRLHATSERCRIATSEKIRHREENQLVGCAGASASLRAVRRLLPVPGRPVAPGRPRVSARGRRACRKADAERGPHIDGSTAF